MLTTLAAVKTFLLGSWKWLAICAALMSIAWLHGCQTGTQREKARQALITAKAIKKARRGDTEARKASDEALSTIIDSNERARNAASGSDDALRDGLNSLRP